MGSLQTTAIMIFAAGVFLLLRDYWRQVQRIEIDEEYTGKDAAIKGMMLRMARQVGLNLPKRLIVFGHIGKKAGAHKRAIAVTRGKSKVDRIITAEELFVLIK